VLASQRQDRILAEVRAHGAVRVADLVEQLDVSEMTGRPTDEPGFAEKSTWATAEKRDIAALAAATLEPGQAVALSAGSTVHLLAQRIAADPALRPLTVVTNSLPVARTLHDAAAGAGGTGLDVILTGGSRTPSDALVGPVADTALATLRVDRLFLGVHGLDESGLMTPNLAEAATDRALLRCAAAVTVLADHTKWGVVGLARIAPLEEVDVVVTDAGLPEPARAVLADAGCTLLTPTDHQPEER